MEIFSEFPLLRQAAIVIFLVLLLIGIYLALRPGVPKMPATQGVGSRPKTLAEQSGHRGQNQTRTDPNQIYLVQLSDGNGDQSRS